MKKIMFAALAALVCLSAVAGCNPSAKVKKGVKFTDFQVTEGNLDGTDVKFSDYVGKGKYVLVDFWASWCGPCKGEIPNIKAVYEKYAGDDFTVVSVAVWDKPSDSRAIIKLKEMKWPQIINAQKVPTDLYGISGIPFIMLIGPDGTVVATDLRGSEIENTVSKYVKAK